MDDHRATALTTLGELFEEARVPVLLFYHIERSNHVPAARTRNQIAIDSERKTSRTSPQMASQPPSRGRQPASASPALLVPFALALHDEAMRRFNSTQWSRGKTSLLNGVSTARELSAKFKDTLRRLLDDQSLCPT